MIMTIEQILSKVMAVPHGMRIRLSNPEVDIVKIVTFIHLNDVPLSTRREDSDLILIHKRKHNGA